MRFTGPAIVAATAFLALTPAAQATFPGRNGDIFYREGWEARTIDPPNHVKAVDPRTGRIRDLANCGEEYCRWSDLGLSPDGRRIALLTDIDSEARLRLMDVRARTFSQIEFPYTYSVTGRPRWSADGQSLLVASVVDFVYRLSIIDLGGTELSVVASNYPGHRGASYGWGYSFDWASTGTIAFLGTVPRDCTEDCRTELFVVTPGGTPRRLTHRGAGGFISWSPDGRWIAFERQTRTEKPYGADVFVIRADGTHLRRVTHKSGVAPAWSPDGRRIAFLRKGVLYTVTPRGKRPHRVGRIAENLSDPDTEGRSVDALEWQARP
jgi:Tol biopolymer transport system component